MRRMVAAAHRDRTTSQGARDRHERRVEDRHQQQEDREEQHRDQAARVRPASDQAEAADEDPDEEAAGVAHEDRGRVEVVDEEAEEGADDDGGERRAFRIAVRDVEHQPEPGGERSDAGGQPVHVVEEVDGVGDPDDPDQRQDDVERRVAGKAQLQAETGERRGDDNLGDELRLRLERPGVVDGPDGEQGQPAGEQQEHARIADRHRGGAGHHGAGDRHAAEQRDAGAMPAVRLGRRDRTDAKGEALDDHRQHDADEEGEAAGEGDAGHAVE